VLIKAQNFSEQVQGWFQQSWLIEEGEIRMAIPG
jgi:hypothetical protein